MGQKMQKNKNAKRVLVDKSLKAVHRNSLVYTKLKFTKQIKKPRKVFHKW